MSIRSRDELNARQNELSLLLTELNIRQARAQLAGRSRLLMPLLAVASVLSAVASVIAAVITVTHR